MRASVKKRKPRVAKTVIAADVTVLEEGWVLGSTCTGCRTHYNKWEPEFQDKDAKHGKYDLEKQLPNTSENYPICPTCLPWYWQAEGSAFGMKITPSLNTQ